MNRCLATWMLLALAWTAATFVSAAGAPCRIEVVEQGSGWPVPLVQLRTTHQLQFVTDNAGVIAVDEPELMDQDVFFHVDGHGYEVPADGFGMRGVKLTLRADTTLQVQVRRTSIARRLGRLTGAGLFAHSQRLSEYPEAAESGVVGCDSVQTTEHRGQRYWLWGDTSLLHYPLGIFHSSSATSRLQPLQRFEPPLHLPFTYFRDDRGQLRGVARMPGDGPTWLSAYVSLPDRNGEPHLVASYAKIKPPLEAYEWGLCVWNERTAEFEPLKTVWKKTDATPQPPPLPQGHAAFWTDEQGRRWVLFGNPLPALRCPANYEAWQDSAQWQTLKPKETLAAASDSTPVRLHSGSIAWHSGRKRWVTVFLQAFGKPSPFGELWYAEADTPEGPWGPAVKILSHDNYTFYNPRVHTDLAPADAPFLLFEGTYTEQFANRPAPTPRYEYNQMLYRLDLDDERLRPAQDR